MAESNEKPQETNDKQAKSSGRTVSVPKAALPLLTEAKSFVRGVNTAFQEKSQGMDDWWKKIPEQEPTEDPFNKGKNLEDTQERRLLEAYQSALYFKGKFADFSLLDVRLTPVKVIDNLIEQIEKDPAVMRLYIQGVKNDMAFRYTQDWKEIVMESLRLERIHSKIGDESLRAEMQSVYDSLQQRLPHALSFDALESTKNLRKHSEQHFKQHKALEQAVKNGFQNVELLKNMSDESYIQETLSKVENDETGALTPKAIIAKDRAMLEQFAYTKENLVDVRKIQKQHENFEMEVQRIKACLGAEEKRIKETVEAWGDDSGKHTKRLEALDQTRKALSVTKNDLEQMKKFVNEMNFQLVALGMMVKQADEKLTNLEENWDAIIVKRERDQRLAQKERHRELKDEFRREEKRKAKLAEKEENHNSALDILKKPIHIKLPKMPKVNFGKIVGAIKARPLTGACAAAAVYLGSVFYATSVANDNAKELSADLVARSASVASTEADKKLVTALAEDFARGGRSTKTPLWSIFDIGAKDRAWDLRIMDKYNVALVAADVETSAAVIQRGQLSPLYLDTTSDISLKDQLVTEAENLDQQNRQEELRDGHVFASSLLEGEGVPLTELEGIDPL